jgi:drug/metabolite transporter (DMT)-like permease
VIASHPLWAATAACGAATAYALTSVLQHRAARAIPRRPALDPRLLLRLLRHPLWLVGAAADLIGIALHATALGLGPLSLVQPLVAGGIVIAVPLDAMLDRRRLGRPALAAVLLGAAGLACFILAAAPSGGSNSPRKPTLIVALSCCLIAVGLCLVINRYADRTWRGTLLGLAAGIAYAGSGALIKVCFGLLGHGITHLLLDWPLYTLAIVGGFGLILNQSAFQTRPLQPALVSMTLATPTASAAIGVLAFAEHLTNNGLRAAIAILAAAAMATGVIASSHTAATPADTSAPPG